MRKIFQSKMTTLVMALGMGALAVSCAQDVDDVKQGLETPLAGNGEVRLRFAIAGEKTAADGTKTGAKTRAMMLDNISAMPDDATFGVYGYASKQDEALGNEPNLIDNGSVKKDGVVKVRGTVADYSGKTPLVQFAAVYPKLSGNDSFKKTGQSQYLLTYSLTTDQAVQKDLMVGQTEEFVIPATATDPVQSGKTVGMHHALTAVNFAIGDRLATGYYIHGIEFKGVHVKGSCAVDMTKSTDAERFTWTPVGDKGSVHIKMPKVSTTQINRTVFTGLKGADEKRDALSIFMIPQTLSAEAKAVIYLKQALDEPTHDGLDDDKRHKGMKKLEVPLMGTITTTPTTPNLTTYKAGEQVVYYLNDAQAGDRVKYRIRTSGLGKFTKNKVTITVESIRYAFEGINKYTFEAYVTGQRWHVDKIVYNAQDGKGEVTLDPNKLPSWLTVSPLEGPTKIGKTTKVTVELKPTDPTYPNVTAVNSKTYVQVFFKQDGGNTSGRKYRNLPIKKAN